MSNVALLVAELPWLVQESSNAAYCLSYRLSQRDPADSILDTILSEYRKTDQIEPTFLAGYLAGIFDRDATRWEAVVVQLADDPTFAERFSDIVISSGISETIAQKVIAHCRQGNQSIERLERWWFARQLKTLSEATIADMIALHLESPTGKSWCNAVHIFHTYYLEGNDATPLPQELTFTLLLHNAMADQFAANQAGYYWSRISSAFLAQYPERKWEFFRGVLLSGARNWRVLSDLNLEGDTLLTDLLRSDPKKAFVCIAEVFEESQELRSYALNHWLSKGGPRIIGDESPGPVQYIPSRLLFEWVDQDIHRRGGWLAHILPKTLDESVAGRLTRDFVARYGGDKGLCASLYAHFHSRGWCGKASDNYRKLRDEARGWIVDEKDSTVIRWVEKYIDGLTFSIERAEIDEEREFN